MSDDARADLYLALGLGSVGAVAADVFLYPRWWILAPLVVLLVGDIIWGILETQ